jgi:hypothetical protein
MNKFKPGDTVTCIAAHSAIHGIALGETYVIEKVSAWGVTVEGYMWSHERFELLHTPSKLTGMTQFLKDRGV